MILEKTILTFNHSDYPSERKHQNWRFWPKKFYSDKNLIPHLIDPFFFLLYRSVEKFASLGGLIDELIKVDIKVDDGVFSHVISSLSFCLFMVGDKQFHAY